MGAENEARDALVAAGRRLAHRGLIIATEGNLSVRLGGDLFLTTPAAMEKGALAPDDLIVVDADGRPTGPTSRRPSSEWALHREIYRLRPDLGAVCHAHPSYALAYACARRAVPTTMMPEAATVLGDDVPVAPYATPGTDEVAESIRDIAVRRDVFLLANHGAVACGRDTTTALHRMETLERVAEVTLLAASVGGGVRLTRSELKRLTDS